MARRDSKLKRALGDGDYAGFCRNFDTFMDAGAGGGGREGGRRRGTAAVGLALVMAFALAVVLAPQARASSTSFTGAFQNMTFTMTVSNPCTGVPGTLTLVANGVFHMNFNPDGTGWFTVTQTGKFTFVPFDSPTDPSYTGYQTAWFGANFNEKNFVATGIIEVPNAQGSDGSTLSFHATETMMVSGTTVISISLSNVACG